MTKQLGHLDARIPNWNLDDLHNRDCPICSFKKHTQRYIRPDGLSVRHCETCDTYFVSPSPSEGQLRSFYSKYDEMHRRAPRISDAERSTTLQKPAHIINDFRIQEILSMMDLKGKICLDVGFGRGNFLEYFQLLGADARGVEVDPKAIIYAKEHLGIKSVTEGTIFDLENTTKFDVIIMNDLIEHPLEPSKLIEKATSLLSSEGILAFFTPNASFINEEDQPIAFRVDLEHMQYFTFATCSFLSKRYGLEIVHLESLGFPYLEGIDELPHRDFSHVSFRNKLKKTISSLPGFETANNIRHLLKRSSNEKVERMGHYHLFCIFRHKKEQIE